MSSPVIPPPLEALRNRPFSFYPAILNIEHNKWQYRKATWTDVLVVNARTGQEIREPIGTQAEVANAESARQRGWMEEYAARTGKFHARILRCFVNSGQGESIPVSCLTWMHPGGVGVGLALPRRTSGSAGTASRPPTAELKRPCPAT